MCILSIYSTEHFFTQIMALYPAWCRFIVSDSQKIFFGRNGQQTWSSKRIDDKNCAGADTKSIGDYGSWEAKRSLIPKTQLKFQWSWLARKIIKIDKRLNRSQPPGGSLKKSCRPTESEVDPPNLNNLKKWPTCRNGRAQKCNHQLLGQININISTLLVQSTQTYHFGLLR